MINNNDQPKAFKDFLLISPPIKWGFSSKTTSFLCIILANNRTARNFGCQAAATGHLRYN